MNLQITCRCREFYWCTARLMVYTRHSAERKAHALALLTQILLAYGALQPNDYAFVRHVTGPHGMYPFAEKEMSRNTLDRILERAERTGDPAWRKPRVDVNTLTVSELSALVKCLCTVESMVVGEVERESCLETVSEALDELQRCSDDACAV